MCLVNGKKSCREEKGTNRFRNDREKAAVAGNNDAVWLTTKIKKCSNIKTSFLEFSNYLVFMYAFSSYVLARNIYFANQTLIRIYM